MRQFKTVCWMGICVCMAFCALQSAGAAPDFQTQWPEWRGPGMSGVSEHADPPIKWSEKTNVKWKVEIPGSGHASPIVWGDKVFVLTAIETDRAASPAEASSKTETKGSGGGMPKKSTRNVCRFEVLALNKETGAILWRRTVREEAPHEGTHGDGSWASGSPITDGELLYAYFGSWGLYCLDMSGNVLWEKELGKMRTHMAFGEGASPGLYGDTLVVNWDHEGDSFAVAFHKKTGEELWRVPRDERTSWATPVFFKQNESVQTIISATSRIRSYDLKTGALLWECGGMTGNVVPTPVIADGLLYAASGFRGSALLCIDLAKAKGDITDTDAIRWQHGVNTPYVPSPLLYNGALYFLRSNNEVLTCLDAKTGKPFYAAQNLAGLRGVYASPVAAAGRVYITGRNGTTVVLEHGPKYKVLATNSLDDSFSASAAFVGKDMFLRGYKALYCISGK